MLFTALHAHVFYHFGHYLAKMAVRSHLAHKKSRRLTRVQYTKSCLHAAHNTSALYILLVCTINGNNNNDNNPDKLECTWFLRIALIQTSVCVCVCVFAPDAVNN